MSPTRILALCLLATLAGCQRTQEIRPPELHLGQDVCVRCNMIISDERFAAAYVTRADDGMLASYAFDDIGCAVAHERTQSSETVQARYVKGYDTLQWIDASGAHYVHSEQIHSPMGFGIAACPTARQAQELSERFPGATLVYAQVLERLTAPKASTETAACGHCPHREQIASATEGDQ